MICLDNSDATKSPQDRESSPRQPTGKRGLDSWPGDNNMDARFVFLSAITERVPLVGYWAGATRESEQGTSQKKAKSVESVETFVFKGSGSVGGLFFVYATLLEHARVEHFIGQGQK